MRFPLEKTFSLFFLSGTLFIPLSTSPGNDQYRLTHFLFGGVVRWIQSNLFLHYTQSDFSSDTVSLFVLLCTLFIFSFLGSFLIKKERFISFTKSALIFYLIYILLRYGIDKISGNQFYTPEPNILYTPFGMLDRDILYWSVNGLSKTYTLITGVIEVLIAWLLFFRKTRIIGLILSFITFTQVIIINLSFDISVKLYSVFLLGITLFLLFPYIKILYNFFFSEKEEIITPIEISFVKNLFINNWIQFFLLGIFLFSIIYPFWKQANTSKFDLLHGGYLITETVYKNDTLLPCDFPYKNLFFHKDQFLILQDYTDNFIDFHYQFISNKSQILIENYEKSTTIINFNLDKNDSIIELNFLKDELYLKAELLDWEALPALRNDFHLFVDEVQN